MKRPWQIWLVFVLCLAIALPAMGWLTLKAIELDRAEVLARQQLEVARQQESQARAFAEQQELVSSALWRMDSMLAPLVAQEAARPYFAYEAFHKITPGKTTKGSAQQKTQIIPSPIIVQPSEYVLLHFQLAPKNSWSSPQKPQGVSGPDLAMIGTNVSNVKRSSDLLESLHKEISYGDLLAMLPEDELPQFEFEMNFNRPIPNALTGNQQNTSTPNQAIANFGTSKFENQFGNNPNPGDGQIANAEEQQTAAPQPLQSQPQAQPPIQSGGSQQVDLQRYASNQAPQSFMRGGNEYLRRSQALQNYAQSQIVQQRQINTVLPPATQLVTERVSRPVWVGSKLLLARRVVRNGEELIQGCWLNWETLEDVMLAEVADLFSEIELRPVYEETTVRPGRLLATLPIQIVLPETRMAALGAPVSVLATNFSDGGSQISAIQLSLIVAWCCMLLTAFAFAVLLHGVVKLSERRGAFVSAVTHELRTPLTTFRMYAEMLAEGMVPDATKRQKYLETLRVEADRLSHLVENVLQYARLERGRAQKKRESVSVADLQSRCSQRLEERATQSNMTLDVHYDGDTAAVVISTDPSAVEQILFNLVDNACKYAASAKDHGIEVDWRVAGGTLEIRVSDHGPGISAKAARKLFRPFSKSVHEAADTAPGVGLGLALSRRLAQDLGGRLDYDTSQSSGATFVLQIPRG